MPYTPPASHSPVASRPETPSVDRSKSCNNGHHRDQTPTVQNAKSSLPHLSSSYLHKHRRSPSVSNPTSGEGTPNSNSLSSGVKSRGVKDDTNITNTSDHIRQHHPVQPAIKDAGVMSPPESSQNSSDDEMNNRRGRGRELANLAELQAAIRIIEQRRVSSPDRIGEESRKARISLGLHGSRFDLPQKASDLKLEASSPPPLSAGARKISHSRSSTTTSALLDFPRNKLDSPSRSYSESDFDEMDEEEVRMKPAMVRKKSGELVRPALRPSSAKGRPASMPGTPTYSKAVHFDTSLEHVRHFLQVDKPIAVSAGSSPVESLYEDEPEFPFGDHNVLLKSVPFEWEISLTNFPNEKLERRALPVRVERVYLSSDNKNLMGAVAAKNIAFHKLVVVRFTLDYWKTTSEVVADFNNDIRHKQTNDGYDRFIFSIKLADQANLENKTMFFCVRYNVNGQEFWDNNTSFNYQVDFSKKPKPQKGKNGMQGNAAKPIPRNNMSPAFSPRPRSLPILSNDFDAKFSPYDFSSYPQPASRIIGDSPIRFRNSKPTKNIVPDAPGRLTSAVGQAFGNRYDFGASLSAAIQASNSSTSDRGGFLRRDEANSVLSAKFTPAHESSVTSPQSSNTTQPGTREQKPKVEKGANVRGITKADPTASPNPVALAAEKPPLQSSSYNELIDKYCFFGSAKTSQPKTSQVETNHVSEVKFGFESNCVSSESSSPSPPQSILPKPNETISQPTMISPLVPRSSSTVTGSGLGSRTASPVSFGYPYRQPMQNGLFAETHTPTAIHG